MTLADKVHTAAWSSSSWTLALARAEFQLTGSTMRL